MLLENIHSPADVKAIPAEQIPALTDEIRAELIRTVSATGGHLASNLGVVELTVALHRVFDCPEDSLIFDVGHQSYVHKLLTGRLDRFSTLRSTGGISGFPNRDESEYDAFGCGHSSTSISAAAGIAQANRLNGSDAFAVAVIGDGSFTGGMAYEALNNCSACSNLIIVLNDNTMSIAKNVGAMDNYLSRFRNSAKYYRMKNGIKQFFGKIPLIGGGLVRVSRKCKRWLKHRLVRENLFEHLGLSYYGPLDGNDEPLLETILREAKADGKCSVVHICTKKGKGYPFAEERPDLYHGVGAFDPEKGVAVPEPGANCFSEVLGEELCRIAEEDHRVCALTAAMPDGTGLLSFQERFPDRFFDVGIAEQHAVTFACGLASKGLRPVFAVYSTFAQRCYDQIVHDCAIQRLPVVFAFDRAGFVGPDGVTHHGIFDVSFLNAIPGLSVYSPESYSELRGCLKEALASDGPSVIRYPKGKESEYNRSAFRVCGGPRILDFGRKPAVAILTYGRMTEKALLAAGRLYEEGVSVRVIKLVKIKPLNPEKIRVLTRDIPVLYFLEEGMREGGVAEHLFSSLSESGLSEGQIFRIRAVEDMFLPHGSNEDIFRTCGFQPDQVATEIRQILPKDET